MQSKAKKILVLDDDETLRTVLSDQINKEGYEACAIDLKHNAYDWVIRNRPDLIISDIKAPIMHGFQFLRWLKLNPFTRDVPFIYLSAYADVKNIVKAKSMGASDFISKPYDMDELLVTIKRVLEQEWSDHIYPSQLSLQQSAEQGLLKFQTWGDLKALFEKSLMGAPERAAKLHEGRAWNMYYGLDHPRGIIGLLFVRPLDVDSLTWSDIVSAREYFSEHGLDRSIIMGFFQIDSSLRSFASLLGVQLVGDNVTNQFLGTILLRRESAAKQSLLKQIGITNNAFEDSKHFLKFASSVFSEISLFIGKRFTATVPKEKNFTQTELITARLESIKSQGFFFTHTRTNSTIIVYRETVWLTLCTLWMNKSVSRMDLGSDQVAAGLLFMLLLHLPSLDASGKEIMLRS